MQANGHLKMERIRWDATTAWRRYCGFLDITQDTFMRIQSQLLMEQIDLACQGRLGRRLMRGRTPKTVQEFRETVPLTTYADYALYLKPDGAHYCPPGDFDWMHTTGAQAGYKWVPYSRRGMTRLLDNVMGALILSTAAHKGEVRVGPGDVVLYNTPPRPYLSGAVAIGMIERFGLGSVLDPEAAETMDFRSKIAAGFEASLRSRVDIIVSMTSVLVKVGESFERHSRNPSDRRRPGGLNTRAVGRMLRAKAKSLLLGRPVRPYDLWGTKSILGWGIDTPFFKGQVERYWGQSPYEIYACTEGGVMGMQSWERNGMVFNPYADFYEFIPDDEARRAREDDRYVPTTVLLDEVEPGGTYEVVLTNFYGMPLMRYRVGHLIRFLEKPASGWPHGPEFEMLGRADDRIDIAGFTRIDEKTIWEALQRSGLDFQEWTVRRELVGETPVLHMYAEPSGPAPVANADVRLHEALKTIDPFYRDLEGVLGLTPVRVTLLPSGTFDRYYTEKQSAGEDLGRLRPPKINAHDEAIADLLRLSEARIAA